VDQYLGRLFFCSNFSMSSLLFSYIAKPSVEQVSNFLRALERRGITVTHLGKKDPPGRCDLGIDDKVVKIFSGDEQTNYTFLRSVDQKLDFDIQIHNDPRWKHSTVSAACEDPEKLVWVSDGVAEAFGLFISVLGVTGGGKSQQWKVLRVTVACPPELRGKFSG